MNSTPLFRTLTKVTACFILLAASGVKGGELASGAIIAWGNNSYGQTNVPPGVTNVVDVACGGDHALAVLANGKVIAWGANSFSQSIVPADLNDVIAVAGGGHFSLALKRDGTVVAWGENTTGQRNVSPSATNVIAIAAGWNQGLALRKDGTVVGWGQDNHGQASPPAGLSNVVAIAGGEAHSIALDAAGKVYIWGQGGQTGPILSNITAIAAGGYHSMALRNDGKVIEWGSSANPVPNYATNIVAIAAGYSHSLAMTESGTVLTWARYLGQGTNVPAGIKGVRKIAGGYGYSIALGGLMPTVWGQYRINGGAVVGNAISVRGPAEIMIDLLCPECLALYTLDGSDPEKSGLLYQEPFKITQSSTLRSVIFSTDFTRTNRVDPLDITILPRLIAQPALGGNVSIFPASGPYLSDDTATITAMADPGWSFLHWLGDAAGTSTNASIYMNREKTVEAVFGTGLGVNSVGNGTVLVSPQAEFYPYGSAISLTAVPAPGSYFVSWGGSVSGTNNPAVLTVTNANPTITALFALLGGSQYYALTVTSDGFGSTDMQPFMNRFPRNTNVVIRAIPQPGQAFLEWSGAVRGTNNPLQVVVSSNMIITANFSKHFLMKGHGNAEMVAKDGFRIELGGTWGVRYRVEASTNLVDWSAVGEVSSPYGLIQYMDGSATNYSHRYYRAIEQ